MAKFDATDTLVFGISMDGFAANKRFTEDIKTSNVSLLSDWKRQATKDYGLFNETTCYGARATFVVDKDGIIRHVEEGRTAIDPSGAYRACDALSKKKTGGGKL